MNFSKLYKIVLNRISGRRLFFFRPKQNIGSIVCLHRVVDFGLGHQFSRFNTHLEISKEGLELIIDEAKRLNVQFISLSELNEVLTENKPINKPILHFSFDDGLLDNYSVAFPIFKKHQIPFSLFISPGLFERDSVIWWYLCEKLVEIAEELRFDKYEFVIDCKTLGAAKSYEKCSSFILENFDKDPEYFNQVLLEYEERYKIERPSLVNSNQLMEMVQSGLCEIGAHTTHHSRLSTLSKSRREQEIRKGIHKLTELIKSPVRFFAYPYGTQSDIGNTEDDVRIFTEEGIHLAFTTEPKVLNRRSNRYLLPRVSYTANTDLYMMKTMLNGCYQKGIF